MNAHFASSEDVLDLFAEAGTLPQSPLAALDFPSRFRKTRAAYRPSLVVLPALAWPIACPKCGAAMEVRQGLQRPVHFGRCTANVASFPAGMDRLLEQAAE